MHIIEPDAPTDFWQRTHYGFRADNGDFRYTAISGPFQMSVRNTPGSMMDTPTPSGLD